jgi:NAD(P)H-dependent FMN reductase
MQKHILAISGSTRKISTNLNLIKAIITLTGDKFDIHIFEGLAEIPHFNPDLDSECPPQTVIDFREQIKAAAGVLICTPEYAMGVPGSLKNAIDWTVSSSDFSHKPTALITASSVGEKGHASLLETLKVIECNIPEESQLLISFAQTKVSKEATITDGETEAQVKKLLDSLFKNIYEDGI